MPPAIRALRCRALAATAISASLLGVFVSACTSDSVLAMRPSVDVGVHTAAVAAPSFESAPMEPALSVSDPYSQPQMAAAPAIEPAPMEPALPASDPYSQPQMAAVESGPMTEPIYAPTPASPEPMPASEPSEPYLGQSEAVEQDVAMTEPAAEPVLPETPQIVPEAQTEVQTAALITPPPRQAVLPRSDVEAVGYPRLDPPRLSAPAAMPADEIACRRELKRLGVIYRELPPINDGGSCRIDHPVKVSRLSGGIEMRPAATLNCEMAASFALWTKRELAPAARFRYMSGVKTIHQGSSYSCRNINGTHTSSEHSRGNALDVMRIELKNGRDIDVRKPGWFAFRQRGFLNSVRADGCGYFTTVLGPGYNYDHRNHFHFDIKPRRNGRRACH